MESDGRVRERAFIAFPADYSWKADGFIKQDFHPMKGRKSCFFL